MMQSFIENKKINISFLDQPCMVYADRNMISTIIRNLLSNAVKFTPVEGTITITISQKNDIVETAVCDTGIGMSEEIRSKLFKIEYSVTTQGTQDEKGTGLGLILCKEFIVQNKGTIRVESTPDVGSKFIFMN